MARKPTRKSPADPPADRQERSADPAQPAQPGRQRSTSDTRRLEEELRQTRRELNDTLAQLERAQGEYRLANGKLQAANEELQTANEELLTSGEELRCVNDELAAVNLRLQEKLEELDWARRAAEEYAREVRRLARFPEENPNPVLRASADGTLMYTNPAARELSQWGLEVGEPLPAELGRLVGRALEEGPVETEVPHGERTLWLAVAPIPEECYVNIYGRDVTERKWIEQALANERRNLQTIFDAANVGMLLLDEHGAVNRVNDTVSKWLGKDLVASLGAQPGAVVGCVHALTDSAGCGHTSHCAACPIRRAFESVLRTGQPVHGIETESVLLLGDKQVHLWLDVSADPLLIDGRRAVLLAMTNITARKAAEDALRDSEQRVRHKLQSVLEPEGDVGELELGDLIDVEALQAAMNLFYQVAHIPMSIIDGKGRLLVGVGWQEICTRFHRVHPVTCRHCTESDTELTADLAEGEVRLCKCKNHMWDMATPIFLGGRRVGGLFCGQFFFEGETVDRDLFARQAREHGFDEQAYLAALDRVPRLSRQAVDDGMAFFLRLAQMVSQLGYSQVKLARLLAERERLTDQLKQGQDRLARAQEIAHLGSWELDLVRNELTWSDEVYRIFGLAPQQFGATYEAFLERVHPDDRAAVDQAYSSSVREGRDSYEIEHRVIRADTGEVRTVHERCQHVRDAAGTIICSAGMVHDITERKAAEQALRHMNEELECRVAERTAELVEAGQKVQAERQRLYDVLETLPVYVILLDADYHVPFANRFFEERFGKSRGKRCYEYLFNRREPCDNCETYKVLKTGKPHHWYWTGPDDRDYDIYDFPFTDTDGSRMILEMGIDITDRNRAEVALRELNQTLERRVAERTEDLARSNQDLQHFAYAAGHDLQEPLRMVSGFLKLLDNQYAANLDDKAREFIGYAVDGSKRMSQLITDLLAYSRVESKGKPPRATDANQSLAAATANLRAVIAESGASVTADPLPTVAADPSQLMQLFQNLLGNALKFRSGDRPCRIHVSAEKIGDATLFPSETDSSASSSSDPDGAASPDFYVFRVADNGIGIEERNFERIFQIFQRLHARGKYPGSGVGLAICKRIIERHGGRMWVESVVAEGTTFFFSLPAAEAPA